MSSSSSAARRTDRGAGAFAHQVLLAAADGAQARIDIHKALLADSP